MLKQAHKKNEIFMHFRSILEIRVVTAAFVYQIQKKNLDKKYLSRWAKELKITKFLSQLPKIDLEKYI